MDPNQLFLRTSADIESRLANQDPYEILLIAGLLRKLFLDDYPLVDQINRTFRVKLEFRTTVPSNKPEDGDKSSFWTVQDGLDPDTAHPGPRVTLTRDQFFSKTVIMVFGTSHSVRDVIQFEANVAGAVHAGSPKTEHEKALHSVGKYLQVGGHAPVLRQLKAIARVSLKALKPLREAVNAASQETPSK